MLPTEWAFRVPDIAEPVGLIEDYVRGMAGEQFGGDRKTIDAVIRNLAIIGEAANHIPEQVQDQYPTVPWNEMRRMPNVVMHAYFRVDVPTISLRTS